MNARTHSHQPVVAAVASMGWAPQPAAVAWAAAEATLRRAPLLLLHGFPSLPYDSGPDAYRLSRQAARAELDDAIRMAGRAGRGIQVRGRLVAHRPDLALLEESGHASTLVLGTKTYAAELVEARFGSVAGALLGGATCPVVAVPSPSERTGRRDTVVVAVDGSPASRPAVLFAATAARLRSVPLTVVHYWPAQRSAAGHTAARQHHQKLLADAVADVAGSGPELRVVGHGYEGDPATELVGWSRRSALIVLGTHRKDRWATAVWGSVSRTLVRESASPVAVVPPSG